MKPADIGLLARTVRHVPVSQILHRVRLRAQKQAYRLAPDLTARLFRAEAPAAPGWPDGFLPVDAVTEAVGRPSLAANLQGRFELLDEAHDSGVPIDWQPVEASQLWRYHLHYFDWAWALHDETSAGVEAFAELYRSWRAANPVGRWDAWSPYVVALRSWALCSIASVVSDDAALCGELEEDLARHARYLRANVEFDVGGNHLLKNLKALVGLGVYLGDERLLLFGARHLAEQLDVQVLSDGGHFERSPGYHTQVLADLIDVHGLIEAAETLPGLVGRLAVAIASMRRWLSVLLRPDGTPPALGDTVPPSPSRLEALGVRGTSTDTVEALEPSGYVVARPRDGVYLVMDVGPPCPEALPAHAQADALSLLLQVDGEDILLDTGTSTYGSGPRRQYERSTRAHNTVEIDGEDQTEVWGAFRAGRRHHVTVHAVDRQGHGVVVDASHDGYSHLPGAPEHRRIVTAAANHIDVVDRVIGDGVHDVVQYWHLGQSATWDAAEQTVELSGSRLRVTPADGAAIEFIAAGEAPLGVVAVRHNVLMDAPCLVVRQPDARLPVELRSRIEF